MTTRNLDFFSTFLEGSRGTSYEPTPAAVKRLVLEALAPTKQMAFTALWKETSAYGVTAPQFSRALEELRERAAISIVRDVENASNPLVVLTPAGVIAADAVADLT